MAKERTGSVKINVPSSPKGELLEIPGLGEFENGKTTNVTEAQILQYESLGFTFPKDGKLELPLPTETPKKQSSSVKDSEAEAEEGGE